MNLLCDRLWEANVPPSIESANAAWQKCLGNQLDKLAADLEPLNTNRLKVLTRIAQLRGVTEPNSKAFIDKVDMPLGSIQKAITYRPRGLIYSLPQR